MGAATVSKPAFVTTIGTLTLISGILNIGWALGLGGGALASIIGAICAPLAMYPLLVGIAEIIYSVKLLGTPQAGLRPAQFIAVFEILTIGVGNIFSLIIGIIALVLYSDPSVKAYFEALSPPPKSPE